MTSIRWTLFLLILSLGAATAADDTFPEPPELRPDIDFWIAIFTEYSTSEGVLHDNRNLGVVYERLQMPAKLSRRERQRRVAARRKELQATLRTLATGKRDNLDPEEARVLALWPEGVGNDTLSSVPGPARTRADLPSSSSSAVHTPVRESSFPRSDRLPWPRGKQRRSCAKRTRTCGRCIFAICRHRPYRRTFSSHAARPQVHGYRP